MIDFEINLVRF